MALFFRKIMTFVQNVSHMLEIGVDPSILSSERQFVEIESDSVGNSRTPRSASARSQEFFVEPRLY